ncbi:MAG: recombinase family protein [Blautia sp.]|nr:recombinase family protein [Blautia sp.]
MKDDNRCCIVAAYGRIGKSKNTQASSVNDLEQQFRAIAEQHNWSITQFYYDGEKDQRSWNGLIANCKSEQIDIVICTSIRCISQNFRKKIHVIRELSERERPVGFWFEEQSIFTLSKDGKLILTIMETVAEEESRQRSMIMKEYYRRKKDVKHE